MKSATVRNRLPLMAVVIVGLGACGRVQAQGSKADYERATQVRGKVAKTVFRDRVQPEWLAGGTHFWYRVSTARDRHEFVWVDAEAGTRSPAFDHDRLAAALSGALKQEFRADALPLESVVFDDQHEHLTCTVAGHRFRCNLQSWELAEVAPEAASEVSLRLRTRGPRASRTGDQETEIVFVNQSGQGLRLFWRDFEGERRAYGVIEPGEERRQHTFAGHVWEAVDSQGGVLAVFVAESDGRRAVIPADAKAAPAAEGSEANPAPPAGRGDVSPDGRWSVALRDHNIYLRSLEGTEGDADEVALTADGTAQDSYQGPVLWSPDSSKLLVEQVRAPQEHPVHLIEASPSDQVQPKLHTFDYLKPGDVIAHPRPRLFDVASRQPVVIDEQLFANPWSISDLRWDGDSRRFTFLYNQRGHQVLRVIGVDAATGSASALIDESVSTFVDYSSKLFYRPLAETAEILWMSERDGWNHLYLYDSRSGQLKNQVTQGTWVVRRVEHVDPERRQIWFLAGGVRPEQDPYYLHLCRVNFDGQEFVVLTEADGTHEVTFSPGRQFFLDRWSRVDQPPVVELRRSLDGKLMCEVERADFQALLATGWNVPERFVAPGRDGQTAIYGVLIRPTDFDPAKSYPVVEQIYAGPHGAHVPKSFSPLPAQHALAELGFIVVQIDGMGTNWRSKAFHDVCWQNLADAGFADRIAWLKAAAEGRRWMDLSRVGIYGGSAGGQNALRALIDHHDFYKVAVADCGCHDNRMDKIWWNEQWMGYPVGPHYEASSNVVHANRLEGKLMLIVGELDRNVDPASTMQVVRALQRADKDFDLVIVAGAGHGAAETSYGSRRRMDFLVRHLHHHEPRWESATQTEATP
ncbi:MAG TPA: prolyl oligopeptidase family serine peptidase [Pirellulales bacterium]|nr:prolyl oligopeptidase family serine peptidase [Pirellulales bacterium]